MYSYITYVTGHKSRNQKEKRGKLLILSGKSKKNNQINECKLISTFNSWKR